MIYTYSLFYYGFTVTEDNKFLDFDEGGSELTAEVDLGNNTLSTIGDRVAGALNDAGTNTYTVSVDRETRKFTITSDGTLNLRVTTGTNVANSLYSDIGFTTNKTGSLSYESDVSAGSTYEPQFKLQSYLSSSDNKELVKATINESTSGALEIVTFGSKSFYEFDIRYINNFQQPSGGPVKSNATGVSDVRAFLDFCIEKRNVEFMPDIDDVETYDTILLETTPESGQGTSYRLKENFGQLPDYF